MLDLNLVVAYIFVATALAVSPGPDVLFVIANGLKGKTRGAIAAALGIGAGSLLHAIAAALGVSALVAASPVAYTALKYAGAAYLLFLGLSALRVWLFQADRKDATIPETKISSVKLFQQGFVTNLLNPKVIIFYLALLPQFVSEQLGQIGLQIFLLGSIHNIIGVLFLIFIGTLAGRASNWMSRAGFKERLDGIAGAIFVGLAISVVASQRASL